jgi:hypothetical protein
MKVRYAHIGMMCDVPYVDVDEWFASPELSGERIKTFQNTERHMLEYIDGVARAVLPAQAEGRGSKNDLVRSLRCNC